MDPYARVESPDAGEAAAELPALGRVCHRTLGAAADELAAIELAFSEQQQALQQLVTSRLGELHGQLSWARKSSVEQAQAFALKVVELSAELGPHRVRACKGGAPPFTGP